MWVTTACSGGTTTTSRSRVTTRPRTTSPATPRWPASWSPPATGSSRGPRTARRCPSRSSSRLTSATLRSPDLPREVSGHADLARPAACTQDVPDQADQHLLDGVPLPCVAQHDGHPGPQAQGDPDVVRLEPLGAVEAVDRDDERYLVPLEVVDR